VWRDILWVGEEACRGPQAEAVVQQIGARLGALGQAVTAIGDRPRVAFLEWLQTVLCRRALGSGNDSSGRRVDALGKVRTPSFVFICRISSRPNRKSFLSAPCGYSAQQRARRISLDGFTRAVAGNARGAQRARLRA